MSDTLHRAWLFVSEDVWKSKSDSVWVHIVKTLNLSVRCFLDERLQEKAAALTYQTLLAIVPALALLFAIGKGFGFQSIITASFSMLSRHSVRRCRMPILL